MVPYAKDGSTFDASCRYPDGFFRVGAKGSEMKEICYYRALGLLAAMATPRWRRPNKKGKFGRVTGRRWR